MLSDYQRQLRDRFLAAPVMPAPEPWRQVAAGTIAVAGLFGGGLHTGGDGGWGIHVVSPEWPKDRVLLSVGGDIYRGSAGEQWWHIFHADYSELRAAGFSPSGRSLVVATSSDITLWTRAAG